MNISILHFAAPPSVGGVEQTIDYHARELAQAGYGVRVIAGAGAQFDPRVPVQVIPELGSRHPDGLRVQAQLACGDVTGDFSALRDHIAALLAEALAGSDVVIAHNVFTLHKNLAFTAALEKILPALHTRVIGWHHDFAWVDPQYRADLHDGYPWDLLRAAWRGVRNVTVSDAQRAQLAVLYQIPAAAITVVPPGVDAARLFGWTPTAQQLADELKWLEADWLFLLPARITRRKNIELALRIVAALRAHHDARLIVTGPLGPHNPANAAYGQTLLALRHDLGLDNAVYFLHERAITPDDDTMAALYRTADALLFPSVQEGFGIPIVEAGLVRLPIFCADLAPLRASGGDAAHYFNPHGDPAEIAARIAATLACDLGLPLRQRVRRELTWHQVVAARVMPLLAHTGDV